LVKMANFGSYRQDWFQHWPCMIHKKCDSCSRVWNIMFDSLVLSAGLNKWRHDKLCTLFSGTLA
jgi:hypothetical protein